MTIAIDRKSLLVDVTAKTTLGACEAKLQAAGLTLDLANFKAIEETTVGDWIASGARGVRDVWLDPADHLVAGLEATMKNGQKLVIRPTPRRAAGPDLIALAVGAEGRFMTLARVWLRVHVRGEERATTHPLKGDKDPPLGDSERALFDAIARELG